MCISSISTKARQAQQEKHIDKSHSPKQKKVHSTPGPGLDLVLGAPPVRPTPLPASTASAMSAATGSAVRALKLGKVQPLLEKWRLFKRSRPEDYGGSYIKNLCATAPHVPYFAAYLCIGLSFFAYRFTKDYERGFEKPCKVRRTEEGGPAR